MIEFSDWNHLAVDSDNGASKKWIIVVAADYLETFE